MGTDRKDSGGPGPSFGPPSPAEHVSESAYEFLLAEILQWVERDEKRVAEEARRAHQAALDLKEAALQRQRAKGRGSGGDGRGGGEEEANDGTASASGDSEASDSENQTERRAATGTSSSTVARGGAGGEGISSSATAAAAVMAAERSAARIERMGYDVGYRLCERLAQSRPLLGPGSPSPETGGGASGGGDAGGAGAGDPGAAGDGSSAAAANAPLVMGGGGHHTHMDPKAQLEAVKFLCKEFWTEVFRKQIDKLQTNHRGVFVLKDHELKWLRRLPPDEEAARVGAIAILAFPCGLIRGALANLGLGGAVVSCDFLADGRTMASCSFNIKVK